MPGFKIMGIFLASDREAGRSYSSDWDGMDTTKITKEPRKRTSRPSTSDAQKVSKVFQVFEIWLNGTTSLILFSFEKVGICLHLFSRIY